MSETSDRLEREINEILGRTPLPPPRPTPAAHHPKRIAYPRFLRMGTRSSAQLLLLSFGLIIAGFLFDSVLPFAGYWLILAGCVLFITSFAAAVFTREPQGSARTDPPVDARQGAEWTALRAALRRWYLHLRG